MESEHIPIYVIDYILEQLIREKQGRQDYIEARKPYFFYLLQSYNIYKYGKALFDDNFVLKSRTLELENNHRVNIREKNDKIVLSYTDLYNRIVTIYNLYWHQDCLYAFVRVRMPDEYVRTMFKEGTKNYPILITMHDVATDRLNTYDDLGWTFELNKEETLCAPGERIEKVLTKVTTNS